MTLVRGCTCYKVRRLARRLTHFYDQCLAPVGLTLTQYSLLCHLAGPRPLTMRELADDMGMDRTTLTRSLKPLEEAGWVASQTGEDRRCRRLALTNAGQTKREAAKPVWKDAQLRINAEIGEAELAELHRLIDLAESRAPAVSGD